MIILFKNFLKVQFNQKKIQRSPQTWRELNRNRIQCENNFSQLLGPKNHQNHKKN